MKTAIQLLSLSPWYMIASWLLETGTVFIISVKGSAHVKITGEVTYLYQSDCLVLGLFVHILQVSSSLSLRSIILIEHTSERTALKEQALFLSLPFRAEEGRQQLTFQYLTSEETQGSGNTYMYTLIVYIMFSFIPGSQFAQENSEHQVS